MKLNILYIHTHDSGRYFSAYGCPLPTPNLQAFADESCTFTNCYCASPTCSPSRASLLTGQFPHTNGMLGLANRGFTLTDYSRHLVGYLNRGGYETALCGIQHEYGAYSDHVGGARAIGYSCDLTADGKGRPESQLLDWDTENAHNAAAWLRAPHEKPFFLSMGFFATHREYPEGAQKQDFLPTFLEDAPAVRADFDGHVESLRRFDRNFGLVLDALKESGQYDNTLVLFTTDHGIPFPGAKCTLTDQGTGVALILRQPGAKANGKCCASLVSQVDIMPTICQLIGLEAQGLQGVSLVPLLENPTAAVQDCVFSEVNFHTSYEPMRSLRTRQWKYIRYYDREYRRYNLSNIDNSPTKSYYMEAGMLAGEKPQECLYDLNADPLEKNNLAGQKQYRDALESCRARLLEWQQKTGDYLVEGGLVRRKEWKINTPQCINPKSRAPEDFLPQIN